MLNIINDVHIFSKVLSCVVPELVNPISLTKKKDEKISIS